jgi:tetratricopeptide (TPR) repeat protein
VESLDSGLPLSLQQLEKRILQLEHSMRPGDGSPGGTEGDIAYPAAKMTEQESKTEAQAGAMNRLAFLLGRGESLLSLGKPQEALASFDEALSLEANYGEALVKKGLALEQLGKNEEALECYDRAIAADGALTVAYLHKGGLYNRMERHGEALQCYERALRTQEQRRG